MAKPLTSREQTAKTTSDILNFLFNEGIYGKRNNTLPIPVVRNGVQVGFRPGSVNGEPDITGFVPAQHKLLAAHHKNCLFAAPFGIEVKTGKDKLSEIQIERHKQMRKMGILILIVKDYSDFSTQWTQFWAEYPPKSLDNIS